MFFYADLVQFLNTRRGSPKEGLSVCVTRILTHLILILAAGIPLEKRFRPSVLAAYLVDLATFLHGNFRKKHPFNDRSDGSRIAAHRQQHSDDRVEGSHALHVRGRASCQSQLVLSHTRRCQHSLGARQTRLARLSR